MLLNPLRFLCTQSRTAFAYVAVLLVLACSASAAAAQQFTQIVVFGDSLSDTGNVNQLVLDTFHLPIALPYADYTYGRFTDGPDTVPSTQLKGVWVEQLAALFPAKPSVVFSLAPGNGTNYAWGDATTAGGTTPLTLVPNISVPVDNIGLQISTYLATSPRITSKTLFIVWGGANNVLGATSLGQVVDGAGDELADIQRLVDAGARQILVANLPPLGAIPRLNTKPAQALEATAAAKLYNDTLATGLDTLCILDFFKGVHVYRLDTFTLFKSIVASYRSYGLENVTGSAQGLIGADPDTYLFWDDLHPTTYGHKLIAQAAEAALLNQ